MVEKGANPNHVVNYGISCSEQKSIVITVVKIYKNNNIFRMMGSDILINFNIGVDSMDSSSGTKGGLRHVASCLDVETQTVW